MERKYNSIIELIKDNLKSEETIKAKELIKSLKPARKRGYLNKEEFMKICMWKSPRPKQRYLSNSEEDIISITKKAFSTSLEKRKIELLRNLKGVSIPVASAILTIFDPKNYGIIDIRVWRLLYLYGVVKTKSGGANFNFNNWYSYLMKLRYFSGKFNVSVRDIERNLFFYHRKIQEGNLYTKQEP